MGAPTPPPQPTRDTMWTIGHWTCPEAAFLDTLAEPGIELLIDIRAQPGSRRSPQFGIDAMPAWLGEAGIGYLHLPELGGRRRRQDVDPLLNAGWHNASFKNFADYTLGPQFAAGLDHLVDQARHHRVSIMCGEPMPWRCHRLLLANILTARGWDVWHLMTGTQPRLHELGRWGATPVLAAAGVLTYPAGAAEVDTDDAAEEAATNGGPQPEAARGGERRSLS